MSKLNVDQKTIKELFMDRKADFLIPDYQRPYAWEEKECQTLWEDIFAFAFPDDDYSKFDSDNEEYYLGSVVTFKNDQGKMEIIDGQQRLTTLMLLLRAFYERFGNMQDSNSISTRENIEKCIWKTDEFGRPDKNALKINSEVASDNDKTEFLDILKMGIAKKEMKSRYAVNYRYFQEQIDVFLQKYPSYFSYLPTRILNNCILLPIEAESQNTALRIFSTLNDRGKPLSDADIFKSQLYKYYSQKGEKNRFIEQWKLLEEKTDKIFHPQTGTPMDELFTRYMYYERAKQGIKSSTTEALRKFYEKDHYALLKNDYVFSNLIELADFWDDVTNLNSDRFENDDVLRKLFVLNYAPNGMWTYFVSVYFIQHKDNWNNAEFEKFLEKNIAFIWAYALTNSGVNALRTPIYAEMINLVENRPVTFSDFKFDKAGLTNILQTYEFSNRRPITKSMLTWWAYQDEKQEILSLDTVLEIEHIFARNRQENEKSLQDENNLECLGNKALLEKRINIRASDYRFSDKKKYYQGYTKGKTVKERTHINELLELSLKDDFNEKDIIQRNRVIVDKFIGYLRKENLLNE
jgi:hypothetical protein